VKFEGPRGPKNHQNGFFCSDDDDGVDGDYDEDDSDDVDDDDDDNDADGDDGSDGYCSRAIIETTTFPLRRCARTD